ncbi:voltage gated chloride channel domain-containing protein [Ditylenchus destructor]|nr:voltage gated chloride channel domain-containing protein [Ditylenchus destructor]
MPFSFPKFGQRSKCSGKEGKRVDYRSKPTVIISDQRNGKAKTVPEAADAAGVNGHVCSGDSQAQSLLDINQKIRHDDDEESEFNQHEETFRQLLQRHSQNLFHFFVEDWFISAMLGAITAVLSIFVDVSYEYLNHYRAELFDVAREYDRIVGFVSWVAYLVVFVTAAALVCRYVAVQAIGSGIPEVKVIMNGFMLENYLSFRTLVAKVLSLTLTLGSGLPVGKEGPFVHMGAIVGTLLSKMTKAWQSNAFFSNEGREMEILSSGCSVGIACTFSSPAGAVLYGIESTHKYFAVKNYWRAFFATTCSALIFRFANAVVIPPHIAGTITAYYQTSFPNEVFLIEEIPVFILVGLLSGLFGALFVLVHRRITYFRKRNKTYKAIFGRNSFAFTIFMAFVVGVITYPDGFGRFIAGKFTFRETLSDFISNCTMSLHNMSSFMGCDDDIVSRWTVDYKANAEKALADGLIQMPNVLPSLIGYLIVNFFLVAICITLALPAGIFVPSFVIGACGGRIIGEIMVILFPDGIRGIDGPQIYPGLYAVVGAAAYTGAVTHSLSIAVIVCETTGQLSPLLPVLIALMVANAVSSFLQPSIYESIITIKKYPHLAELPPSRISVHTLKVEQIMVSDVVYVTRQTTYKELRELLIVTPHLRSYPLVTDDGDKILLGSVARKYLHFLLTNHLGPDPSLLLNNRRRKNRNASELFGSFRRNSTVNLNSVLLNDRNVCGNTLLSISPLHEEHNPRNSPLAPLLRQAHSDTHTPHATLVDRATQLKKSVDLDEVAIDPAPFQLVQGTSLYKVHTLFSLLGLNHAYVTHRGKLIGVVALRELRLALANIYTRGAVPPATSQSHLASGHQRKNSRALSLTENGYRPGTENNIPPSRKVSRMTREFQVTQVDESGIGNSNGIRQGTAKDEDDPFTEADDVDYRKRSRAANARDQCGDYADMVFVDADDHQIVDQMMGTPSTSSSSEESAGLTMTPKDGSK